jgi:zinc protease
MRAIPLIAKIVLAPLLVLFAWWGIAHYAKPSFFQPQTSQSLLRAKTWTLKSGMHVYWLPATTPHMIDISVAFDAGSRYDGALFGLASLTNRLFLEGTTSLNATQFSEEMASLGAKTGAQMSREMAMLHLRTLSQEEYRLKAIDLFVDMLSHPGFRTEDLARLQKQRLVQLSEDNQRPARLAENAFYNAVFNHTSYAHPPQGTPESVKVITPNHVLDFYQQFYTPDHMTIAFVGDLTEADAQKIAEQLANQLPVSHHETPSLSAFTTVPPEHQNIAYPSEQTHIWLGGLNVDRSNPDYIPLSLGQYIVAGSGMNSVLFEAVRNKKGLAYSVSGTLIPLTTDSLFTLFAQTRTSEAQETLSTIIQE